MRFAALAHVARNPKLFGIDPARLGVAGDSAGGTLAAVLCRIARDAGRRPRSRSSFCSARSWMCMANPPPAANWRKAISWTAKPCCATWSFMCRPASNCPICACRRLCAEEFAGLPPAFIHTGQFDPFGDEGEEYAQRLGGFGVAVHGRAHPGMIHYFYCMPRMIPYAQEAMRIIGSGNPLCGASCRRLERRIHRRIRPELIRA